MWITRFNPAFEILDFVAVSVLSQDIQQIMVFGCVLRERRDIGHSLRQDSAGVSSYNHTLVARFDNVPYVVG
ncbi:MAG: hypothetical protein ABSC50_14610 [Candidatus Bathyarchaeia archaeon]